MNNSEMRIVRSVNEKDSMSDVVMPGKRKIKSKSKSKSIQYPRAVVISHMKDAATT